jgi:hypothetical protein
MAGGIISIALKAVDQYSGVLTGLNQGFELVSKGINFMKGAADAAFGAINKGVELARIGGAFQEQRNQFENLAKSYGVSGQSIIDTVKKTSANTLSEFNSISIATRALAAGLQGQDLNNALSYVKRWSEATGESFDSVAERVFTSLSSGRYAVLRQMGLVIENGATLNDVTKAMAEGLKRFGDTGFNAADKLDAVTASQEDFNRKLGQGINNSEKFQAVLGTVSDRFVELINSFDPAPISAFVDFVIDGAISVYKSFNTAFPEVFKIIDNFFKTAASGGQGWAKAFSDLFFEVLRAAATTINTIISIFTDLNKGNFISGFVDAVLSAFALVGGGFAALVSGLTNIIADTLKYIDQLALYYTRKFPKLAELIGLDNVNFSALGEGLRETVGVAAGALSSGLLDLADKGIPGINKMNESLESMKFNLGDIDTLQKQAGQGIDEIGRKYGQAKDQTTDLFSSTIRIQLDDGSFRDVETSFSSLSNAVGSVPIGVNIDAESDEVLDKLKGIKDSTKDIKVDARLQLKADDKTKTIADYIIEKVGGVSWPAAMQQIMDAMLTMLIAAVANEPLPIAITNFKPV